MSCHGMGSYHAEHLPLCDICRRVRAEDGTAMFAETRGSGYVGRGSPTATTHTDARWAGRPAQARSYGNQRLRRWQQAGAATGQAAFARPGDQHIDNAAGSRSGLMPAPPIAGANATRKRPTACANADPSAADQLNTARTQVLALSRPARA